MKRTRLPSAPTDYVYNLRARKIEKQQALDRAKRRARRVFLFGSTIAGLVFLAGPVISTARAWKTHRQAKLQALSKAAPTNQVPTFVIIIGTNEISIPVSTNGFTTNFSFEPPFPGSPMKEWERFYKNKQLTKGDLTL